VEEGAESVKDVFLAIAPAAFGLIGTALGAFLAQRSAAGERQLREDDDARKALADLLDLLLPASGFYTEGPSGETRFMTHLPDPKTLGDRVRTAEVALVAAGIPWKTVSAWFFDMSVFATNAEATEAAAGHQDALAAGMSRSAAEATNRIDAFMQVLDRSRRYRRSGRTARRIAGCCSHAEVTPSRADIVT
jgi:hypothetical protein